MADQSAPALAVVPAHVQDAGRFVQQTAEALISGIHSGDKEIQGLMSTWKGAAASAYLAGWEETRRGALEVLEALRSLAELLGVTATMFTEQDETGAAGVAGADNPSTRLLNM
ncbi:WXG100 family type VII secretion target [Nocardia sp. NPDC003482]